jgi:hypothetical protein
VIAAAAEPILARDEPHRMPSTDPSPPLRLPTMSLLSTASMRRLSARAFCACSRAPTSPCSSPASAMKTSVASTSSPLWANTRASSSTTAVPLPSSFAPGAVVVRARRRGVLGRRAQHHRVVVAAHVHAPRALPGKHGHHVDELHSRLIRPPGGAT